MAARTTRYDALVEKLESEVRAERYAAFDLTIASGDEALTARALELAMGTGDEALGARAFDLVLASEDEQLKLRAFDLVLASGDERLKARAIDMAVASDDEKLKARAVSTLPRITQWVARVEEFSHRVKGNPNFQPNQIIGPPKNDPCSSDNWPRGWLATKGTNWIRVRFAKPVRFPQIVVYETGSGRNSVGFVRAIRLQDLEGNHTDYAVRGYAA